MAFVEVEHLWVRYGTTVAVRNLSFAIPQGEVFGFIGPNGAGKTTTIKVLATLIEPAFGSVRIGDTDVVTSPHLVRRRIGYMPDFFGVYDDLTVSEYLHFFAAAYRMERPKRKAVVADVLALTDLAAKRDTQVDALSRGMKQRLGLARVLLHDPDLLLLDEPASGLDPRARIEIKELLKTLRDMGKTILISSHILSELGDMCNKIAIIERGELLASGGFREILDSVRQTHEVRLEVLEGADAAAELLATNPGIVNVDRSGNEFQMEATLGRAELASLLNELVRAGVKVLFFGEEKETLEDVFLHVTKGGI